MKVILADTYGFCGGVKKAVNLIYSQLNECEGTNILMEGPIIHNNSIIKDLDSKGVKLLGDNKDLKNKKIVVRAHGITPQKEVQIKNWGGEIVDGTCPIVKASQLKIKKYAQDGYFIVITGDIGHAEVIGLVGYAPESSVVVASTQDLQNKHFPPKTVLISQTTFSKPEFYKIEKELKDICPTLETLCTICSATKDRQDSVKRLADEVDAIIVVGGINSSNTKRLKLAVEDKVPTWLIEDSSEIPKEISKYKTVGVTAGASTPDFIINQVVTALELLPNRDKE
ncbi:MAG: 4-hydroxy-3-methylbut-2-enyl diphosphate reductase [Spirochaetales bacterium]|nr:4-hydroxy-3-methylbut-2-enyl diphosphate reductase [Spirochaetales bacterium]